MDISRSSLLLVLAISLSLYHKAACTCSKSCVHIEGASSINLQAEDTFCKNGTQYNDKPYYERTGTPSVQKYLYFDKRDYSWIIASSLGATTVDAIVYDTAFDPTNITSTWETGPPLSYDSSVSIMMGIPNKDIKVKCGEYKATPWGAIGGELGFFIGVLLLGCGTYVCAKRAKRRREVQRQTAARRANAVLLLLAASRRQGRTTVEGETNPSSTAVLPPSYEGTLAHNSELLHNTTPPSYADTTTCVTGDPTVTETDSGLPKTSGASSSPAVDDASPSKGSDGASCETSVSVVSCPTTLGHGLSSSSPGLGLPSGIAERSILQAEAEKISSSTQGRCCGDTVVAVEASEDVGIDISDTQNLI